ncbi:DUF2590 family protein [uncultured Microbulbifer sp.]|uniref:DUF2590 family protein n=1 Tax=uncultured Microbulbifer sp. TaxID=348147 RepID=UPI00262D9320|nr:DUF2590 family protein [uncultured Microbulbifer sp.]
MAEYVDLLISERDLTLDEGGFPVLCDGRVSIGQDIKHRILESGLALQLIAERDPARIARIENQILLLVDQDTRIRPGTAKLTVQDAAGEQYILTAKTMKYGDTTVTFSGVSG